MISNGTWSVKVVEIGCNSEGLVEVVHITQILPTFPPGGHQGISGGRPHEMKGILDDSETKRSDMHQHCLGGIIGISSIRPQWKDHCIDDLTLSDTSCRHSLDFEKSFLGLVE